MRPVIELVEATLVRGGVRVLDRVSVTIHQGEHTAILGPNGAGKSSLIRMFTLDERPLRDSPNSQLPNPKSQVPNPKSQRPLRLFGRETWDVEELRRRLGVVTGDLDLGFGAGTSGGRVSGLDVALSGLFGSQGVFAHHTVTPAMREQAHHALRRVEAGHLAARPLNRLSTGERRRVLIARALVTDPEALVLDEPAAGLDPVARHRFMESVATLAGQGTTVILVTHHVEEIFPGIRKVVLLRQGRVAFDGPPAAGLTSARLSDLFGAPVVVGQSGGYFHVRVQTPATAAADGERR
jgi:iron complex transport system ATP-binding protein